MEHRIGKITMYEHLDADKINGWITAGDTLFLDVERRYALADIPDTLTAVLPAGFGTTYMAALTETLDAATYVHEQGCIVFKIVYDSMAKSFDLTQSYLRNDIDSTASAAVAAGTKLIAVFSTPALPDTVKTQVTLLYGQAISTGDIAALSAVGIVVGTGGTGSGFSLTGKLGFTVAFYQPVDAMANYIIDFNMQNQVIQL